jgi:hypothetical protein
MKRRHVFAVAVLLGSAAAFGVIAASRTAGLGPATSARSSRASVSARVQRLDRVELALRRALRDRPPALPAVPRARTASAGVGSPQIVYQRPAPIVVVRHRPHADEGGADREGGGDD